jgi:DNA-binding MarR family transcriptional regulator
LSNNLKILLDNPKPFPLAFKYAKLILAPIEEYGHVPDQNKYQLEDQIGFKLRLANQKHLEVFSQLMPEITPTQFAVLAKLEKTESLSQNLLGRLVGMDASTTQGVVHRLKKKGYVQSTPSQTDLRRLDISLTADGRAFTATALKTAQSISKKTARHLSQREHERLLALLDKI